MPRPRIAMRKIRDVLRLTFGEGLSRRQVSASLGIPLTTVGDYVGRAEAGRAVAGRCPTTSTTPPSSALFPPTPRRRRPRPMPDWSYVHTELRKKGVTLQLLWLEYREPHPDGLGYSQFCHHYQAWRRHVDVVMRQHHRAGREDSSSTSRAMTIPIYDRATGEVALRAELFVAVLGASSYLYAEALRSQELAALGDGPRPRLRVLRRRPRDRRAATTCARGSARRPLRARPQRHLPGDGRATTAMAIVPARPYKPRDKAKVEAGVSARRALDHRRAAPPALLLPRGGQRGDPACVERDQREALQEDGRLAPASSSKRSTARRCGRCPPSATSSPPGSKAKVNIDYHVEVDRHYYSVPTSSPASRSTCASATARVEVFFCARRVASHLRSSARFGHTTDPAHMPESPPPPREWTPRASSPGRSAPDPPTAALVEAIMAARPHPEQGFRSALGIIRLGDRYGTERVEAACARALHLRSYSYRSRRVDPHARPRPPAAARAPRPPVPIPITATSAVRTTTAERRHMLTQPDHRRASTLELDVMAQGLLDQRGHPDYEALSFEERLGSSSTASSRAARTAACSAA